MNVSKLFLTLLFGQILLYVHGNYSAPYFLSTRELSKDDTIKTVRSASSCVLFDFFYDSCNTYIMAESRNKGMIFSPAELIQGRIPGLQITRTDGRPGGDFIITNRLRHNLLESNSPVIMLDGMIVEEIHLNPEDIKSITFLDDPVSMAMFSQNGVLLIETKKSDGILKANYSGKLSFSPPPKAKETLSGDEVRELVEDRYGSDLEVLNLAGTSNTNWQDEIYQPAIGTDHFLEVAGKVSFLPVRISAGKSLTDGVISTSHLNRNTATLTLNPSLFRDQLKMDLGIHFMHEKSRMTDEMVPMRALFFDPTQAVSDPEDPSGYFSWKNALAPGNPVAMLKQSNLQRTLKNLDGHLGVEYASHFLPGLKIGFYYAQGRIETNNSTYIDTTANWTWVMGKGRTGRNSKTIHQQNTRICLGYSKQFNSILNQIDLIGGMFTSKVKHEENTLLTTLVEPVYEIRNTNTQNTQSDARFFSAMNMGFAAIIDLKVTASLNNNSMFVTDQKRMLNTGGQILIKLKNIGFMKKVKHVDRLDVFLSRLDSYINEPDSPTDTSGNFNPYVKPQRLKSFSTGASWKLFSGRVWGILKYKNEQIKNQLLKVPIASGSNFDNYLFVNAGTVRSYGWELNISLLLLDKHDWKYRLDLNGSFMKNKLSGLPVSLKNGISTGFSPIFGSKGIYLQQDGQPVNSFFVLQQVYYAHGRPIEGLYVDRSGEGNTSADLKNFYSYHTMYPIFLAGFQSNLVYRKWSFEFSGRINLGNYVYNYLDARSGYERIYSYPGYLSGLPGSIVNSGFEKPQYYSDYFIENASFFKMDNISIGYRFDKIFKHPVQLSTFFTARNIITISQYSGSDPELYDGVDQYRYPVTASYSLGVNLGF